MRMKILIKPSFDSPNNIFFLSISLRMFNFILPLCWYIQVPCWYVGYSDGDWAGGIQDNDTGRTIGIFMKCWLFHNFSNNNTIYKIVSLEHVRH